jgi:hypothetical protein
MRNIPAEGIGVLRTGLALWVLIEKYCRRPLIFSITKMSSTCWHDRPILLYISFDSGTNFKRLKLRRYFANFTHDTYNSKDGRRGCAGWTAEYFHIVEARDAALDPHKWLFIKSYRRKH